MKKLIEKYAVRGELCDVMKALTLLTQAYINMCGISLGNRTVVYYAAEPWQERLAWMDLPLSEMALRDGCNYEERTKVINGLTYVVVNMSTDEWAKRNKAIPIEETFFVI